MNKNLELSPTRLKHEELLKHSNEIVDLYINKNLSTLQIAKIFNTNKKAIKGILLKNNIKLYKSRTREYNLKCPECYNFFKTKSPTTKRCQNCKKDQNIKYTKNRQRKLVAQCKYCGLEMPNMAANREYCNKCRILRKDYIKKQWRKNNPEKFKEQSKKYSHERRMRKYGKEIGRLFDKFSEILLKECDNKCVYCESKTDLTIDHILALIRDGSNDKSNLVIACRKCNSGKRDKFLLNFLWKKFSSERN